MEAVFSNVFQVIPGALCLGNSGIMALKPGRICFLKFSSAGVELDPCGSVPLGDIP